MAFSPDGERICCSCVDLTVRVYTTDAALAGKGAQATLKCVGDFVTACDFSYDGAEVVRRRGSRPKLYTKSVIPF